MSRKVVIVAVVAVLLTGTAAYVLVGTGREEPLAKLDPAWRASHLTASGTVTRPDGAIYWEEYGEATKPPVVVLHGRFGSIEQMGAQLPALAEGRRVLALDARGFGRSTNDAATLTFEAMADDVVAVMDARKIERADVVGWTFGANAALALAQRHGGRVGKLVVISANRSPEGMVPRVLEEVRAIASDSPLLKSVRGPYESLSPHPERWTVHFEHFRSLLLTQPQWTDAALAGVQAPVLLVYGEEDEVQAEHAKALQAALPGAKLSIVKDGADRVPVQQALEVNALISEFLR
jgi:pimeloyl-ACP methyl ester carboxylesterase